MTVDEGVRRSYLPGDWFGIFGESAAVLLPPSEKRRVAALWELLDDGAGFDEVLDALIATGLRDLPGFLLVSDTDQTTRVVVRGAARATFESADGTVAVDAGGAGTWVERTVRGVTATVLDVSSDTDGPATGAPMTLAAGLVRVSRVETPALVAGAPSGTPVAAPVAAPVADRAAPPPDSADEHLAEPVAESALLGDLEPPAAVAEDEGESTQMMSFEELTERADEASPHEEEPALEASLPGDPLTDGSYAEQRPDAPAPEAPGPATPGGWTPGPTPPPAPAFGSGSAPERPGWSPETPPANPFGPGPSGPPAAEQHPPPEPGLGGPQQPEAPRQPAGGWGEPAYDQPGYGDPAPADPADHDGNTAGGGYDADVYAHAQPGIPGQPPAPSVTSQPVARLMLSHGEQVEVDRAIVVGRAPEARRFTASDQPRLVTVPSPNHEISSTHLEVRPGSGADHGSAVVTDMGSTNGTVLVQPGLPPEDLQPGIAVQLIPGAVIDLGDGLTIQVTNP